MRKIARITLGFLALIAGLVLAIPGVPGPGIPIMIVGLVLLSNHFEWARRLLAWIQKKYGAVRDRLAHRPR